MDNDKIYIGEKNSDGEYHGYGILKWNDNMSYYVGEFKNGFFRVMVYFLTTTIILAIIIDFMKSIASINIMIYILFIILVLLK